MYTYIYKYKENEPTIIARNIGNGSGTSSKSHIMASFTVSKIPLRTSTFKIAQVYAACAVIGWC